MSSSSSSDASVRDSYALSTPCAMSGDCLSIALMTAQESAREAEVGVGVADLADRLARDRPGCPRTWSWRSRRRRRRGRCSRASRTPRGRSGRRACTASRTPSEIWSAILSGWPSVTDSEVNRYSLSHLGHETGERSGSVTQRPRLLALVEVDDHRDALERVALAQPVLDEVRVLARDARAAVDLDREPRRADPDLGHVEHLQAVALLGRRLPRGGHLGEEAVELRRGHAVGRAVGQRERLLEQPRHVAAVTWPRR